MICKEDKISLERFLLTKKNDSSDCANVADNKTVDSFWSQLRVYQPTGPIVDSEFYPGWLTHWQEGLSKVQPQPIVDTFRFVRLNWHRSIHSIHGFFFDIFLCTVDT